MRVSRRGRLAERGLELLNGLVSELPAKRARNPWTWIPTLYFTQGVPYALVALLSSYLYKDFGVDDQRNTFYTSLLTLPWVLKPLWSPAVDIYRTRREWIWFLQLIMGAGLVLAAMAIGSGHFFAGTLAMFFVVAACSATHDIAADGFYILANSEGEQTFFSGVRSAFFKVSAIAWQGGLLVLVGWLTKAWGYKMSWQVGYCLAAAVLILTAVYHRFILPRPEKDKPARVESARMYWEQFFATFGAFFQKRQILVMLFFLLTYRLGEVQLTKISPLFLKTGVEKGGLGIANEEMGLLNGLSLSAFLVGAALGGFLVSRHGLKRWLWPMVIILHAPDLVYVYLSRAQPQNLGMIGSCLAVEQFGYGFGFSAYMLYMLYMARGEHPTAHYAICTGFMALGAMLPGMASGSIEEKLGYANFFVWVLVAAIPGCVATALIPLEKEFGRKRNSLTD